VSHANRGKAWEQHLELFHARYEARGDAVVIRTPPPMRIIRSNAGGTFIACYEKEGPPDYVLLTRGKAVMAEAKECSAKRWALKNLHPHQAKRLTDWANQGGHSIILLHHKPSSTYWTLPWPRLRPIWDRWYMQSRANRRAASGSASLGIGEIANIGLPFGRDGYLETILNIAPKLLQ
jgi:penicillin-binding protein-related factor A (putative recombinase)